VIIDLKKSLFPALITVSLFAGWIGLNAGSAVDTSFGPVYNVSGLDAGGLSGAASPADNKVITNPSPSPDVPAKIAQWVPEQIIALAITGNIGHTQPVLVAVLDTGIDKNHEDLNGKVVAEINFTDSPTAGDICGHGTSVAGIIAAGADNGLGIDGVAPESRLMSVKVADDHGKCLSSALAEGIVWAVDHGAMVINISLEFQEPAPDLKEALDYAWSRGAVIVAAAGNDGSSKAIYPAFYDNCMAVTAVRENGTPAPLANYGGWVDTAAYGYKIYTTLPGNGYGYRYGTSFAAAYISGLAANLFSLVIDTNGDGRANDEIFSAIKAGYIGTNFSSQ
jgi:thermitase